MFSLRYLARSPEALKNIENCSDWEDVSTDERRVAAELSFLFFELQVELKSRAKTKGLDPLDPNDFRYNNFWEEDSEHSLTYETKTMVQGGNKEAPLYIYLKLASESAIRPRLVIFGGLGLAHQVANKQGKRFLRDKYLSDLCAKPTNRPTDNRIQVLVGEAACADRLDKENGLDRICLDLSGSWEKDDPREFLDLCIAAFDFLVAEAKRLKIDLGVGSPSRESPNPEETEET